MRLPWIAGLSVVAVPFTALAAGRALYNRDASLLAWAVKESTGTATAALTLFDGSGTGGVALVPLGLAAGESVRESFGPAGVPLAGGVFLDVTAGSVSGCLVLGLGEGDG